MQVIFGRRFSSKGVQAICYYHDFHCNMIAYITKPVFNCLKRLQTPKIRRIKDVEGLGFTLCSSHFLKYYWIFDINSRTRVVLVLALPPPHLSSPVDLDLLDCLQQEAVSPMVPPSSSGCGGPIKLPHCTPKPQEKADKVFMRCGGETSKIGVGVICWGCSVWHR